MLAYYFKEAPHLLRPAIEDQFHRLADAREKSQQSQSRVEEPQPPSEGADLVLYRCVVVVCVCDPPMEPIPHIDVYIPRTYTNYPPHVHRRMEQLKAAEERAMVEDLMYVSILEKFASLGVDMLPRIDDYVHTETPSNLKVCVFLVYVSCFFCVHVFFVCMCFLSTCVVVIVQQETTGKHSMYHIASTPPPHPPTRRFSWTVCTAGTQWN